MGIVIRRLYFGNRPDQRTMAKEGSILRRWNERGFDWEHLALVVEGLAIRRDRGELKSIRPDRPVSLRWVNDKDQTLNQMAVCLDAVYREAKPKVEKVKGSMADISSILSQFAKGA
jgi:hypothetical protein